MSSIRRFAVYEHFEGTSMTREEGDRLTAQRALHAELVSLSNPLKVRATVTAPTIHDAVDMLEREVARVIPGATATNVNAIELSPPPLEAVTVSAAS